MAGNAQPATCSGRSPRCDHRSVGVCRNLICVARCTLVCAATVTADHVSLGLDDGGNVITFRLQLTTRRDDLIQSSIGKGQRRGVELDDRQGPTPSGFNITGHGSRSAWQRVNTGLIRASPGSPSGRIISFTDPHRCRVRYEYKIDCITPLSVSSSLSTTVFTDP